MCASKALLELISALFQCVNRPRFSISLRKFKGDCHSKCPRHVLGPSSAIKFLTPADISRLQLEPFFDNHYACPWRPTKFVAR
jgi:hypothetical protein